MARREREREKRERREREKRETEEREEREYHIALHPCPRGYHASRWYQGTRVPPPFQGAPGGLE
eukprot:6533374-Alexandrium_andersonii.AAC.1